MNEQQRTQFVIDLEANRNRFIKAMCQTIHARYAGVNSGELWNAFEQCVQFGRKQGRDAYANHISI